MQATPSKATGKEVIVTNPVVSHNDAKVIRAQAKPIKLMSAEQMAESLGTSVSHLYAVISKQKPEVKAVEGKTRFYDSAFLEHLQTIPRRHRQRHVVRVASPVRNKVVQTGDAHKEPLLQRLERLESLLQQQSELLEQANLRIAALHEFVGA